VTHVHPKVLTTRILGYIPLHVSAHLAGPSPGPVHRCHHHTKPETANPVAFAGEAQGATLVLDQDQLIDVACRMSTSRP